MNTEYADCGISVLMPAHNPGRYLQAAVDSILKQTHRKLELILIDDFSSDNSIQSLPKSSRLRVIHSPTKGIVPALNEGIKQSRYSIIARMDADDIAHPQRLELQLQLLLSGDVDIVGTKVDLFSESQTIGEGYQRYQTWINQQITHEDISKNFWVESCIPHPSAMMRKKSLTNLQNYKETSWPEDYDLWCRAYLTGYRFAKPDQARLLRWRDYSARTSRTDSRYSTDQFFRCKAHYLSKKLLHEGHGHCNIWGAGPTGTKLARYLSQHGIQINRFIDVNPKLRGRTKLGRPITIVSESPTIEELNCLSPISLIAVRSWGAREQIRSVLLASGFKELIDFIVVA